MIQKQKGSVLRFGPVSCIAVVAFEDQASHVAAAREVAQDRMDLKPDNDATRVHGTKRLRPL